MSPGSDASPARLLEWDSEFFGFRIARLASDLLTKDLVGRVFEWCKDNDIRCLYFRSVPDNPETILLAEQHGFHQVDVRVVLDRQLGDVALAQVSKIRSWKPADLPRLKEIAAASHRDSRFYFDHRFGQERCEALYQTWIERSCEGFAQHVLIAQFHDQPVGYLTCHLTGDKIGSIGLMAVAEKAQGQGLGKDLVKASLSWFADQGATHVRVVTQGRNIAAQRLYQACGFRTCAVHLWYHWWSPLQT